MKMKITIGLILVMLFIPFASLKKTTNKNATSETKSETETTSDSVVTVGSSQASTKSSQGSTTIATSRKAKRKKGSSKETATSGKSTTKQDKTDFNVPYGKYGVQPKHFLGDDERYDDKKSSARSKAARWPNYTVPYEYENGTFSATDRKYVEDAMRNISKVCKVKFVQRTNQEGYLNITKTGKWCYAMVGYGLGARSFNLAPECIAFAAEHELLHTLGIIHEQERPDRDKYIKINWDNVKKDKVNAMKPASENDFETFDLEYGYDSIMHYHPYSYAIDPTIPTMVPRDGVTKLGRVGVLTKYDIKRLNLMYP